MGALLPWPRRARAFCSKRQGAVMEVQMKMVARFGKVRQPGKRARDEQSARRHPERVD